LQKEFIDLLHHESVEIPVSTSFDEAKSDNILFGRPMLSQNLQIFDLIPFIDRIDIIHGSFGFE
jgi:hypothetical protein